MLFSDGPRFTPRLHLDYTQIRTLEKTKFNHEIRNIKRPSNNENEFRQLLLNFCIKFYGITMILQTNYQILRNRMAHHHIPQSYQSVLLQIKAFQHDIMVRSPELQNQALRKMIYYKGITEDKLFNPVQGGFNVNAPNYFIQKIRAIYYLLLVCVFQQPENLKDLKASISNFGDLQVQNDMFSSKILMTRYGTSQGIEKIRRAFDIVKFRLYSSEKIPKNRKKYFIEFVRTMNYTPKSFINKISTTINKFPVLDEILIDTLIEIVGSETIDDNLNIENSLRDSLGLDCHFEMFRQFTIEGISIKIIENGFRIVENKGFMEEISRQINRWAQQNGNSPNKIQELLDVSRVGQFKEDVFEQMGQSYIFELDAFKDVDSVLLQSNKEHDEEQQGMKSSYSFFSKPPKVQDKLPTKKENQENSQNIENIQRPENINSAKKLEFITPIKKPIIKPYTPSSSRNISTNFIGTKPTTLIKVHKFTPQKQTLTQNQGNITQPQASSQVPLYKPLSFKQLQKKGQNYRKPVQVYRQNIQNKEGIDDQKFEFKRTLTSPNSVQMNQGYVFKTKSFRNCTIPSQCKIQSYKNLEYESQSPYSFAELGSQLKKQTMKLRSEQKLWRQN